MGRRSETTTKVFVGSLPPNVTTDDLRRLFAPYGGIAECDIANRCGFLHMEDPELAMKAIDELHNTTFMGGRISVEKGRVSKPARKGRNNKSNDIDDTRKERNNAPYPRERPRKGGYDRNNSPFSGSEQSARSYNGLDERRGPFNERRDRRGGPPSSGFNSRGYDGPPLGRGYDAPPLGRGYEAPPPGRGYEPPPLGRGYEAPPPGRGYEPPPGRGYEAPAAGRGYEAPSSGRGYDDRRVPPDPGDYERRHLNEQPSIQPPQQQPRPLMAGYERNNEMFSRRDSGPKPLLSGGNTFNRPSSNYNQGPPPLSGIGQGGGGYGDRPPPLGAPFGPPSGQGSYNNSRSNFNTGAYQSVGGGSGGNRYGNNYGPPSSGRGNYESSYPPLLPQRSGEGGGRSYVSGGLGSGGGGGSGPRRDLPPSRRY